MGGKLLNWDAENMKVKGMPDADKYIRESVRKGWEMQRYLIKYPVSFLRGNLFCMEGISSMSKCFSLKLHEKHFEIA